MARICTGQWNSPKEEQATTGTLPALPEPHGPGQAQRKPCVILRTQGHTSSAPVVLAEEGDRAHDPARATGKRTGCVEGTCHQGSLRTKTLQQDAELVLTSRRRTPDTPGKDTTVRFTKSTPLNYRAQNLREREQEQSKTARNSAPSRTAGNRQRRRKDLCRKCQLGVILNSLVKNRCVCTVPQMSRKHKKDVTEWHKAA